MTFRTILGRLGKTLKWSCVLLVAVYGLLLAINAVDEELTPEAKALYALPETKAPPDNGYLALVAFDAPADTDVVSYGKQWVDLFNVTTDNDALVKANARFDRSKPLFKGDTKQLCDPTKTACLPEARKNSELWHKIASENRLLLDRQRRLNDYKNFEDIYFPPVSRSPIPYYNRSQRLLELDMIALDVVEGRLVPALDSLETRIAFDRRALHGARSLLLVLYAVTWLRQDYALLAEIVATRSDLLASQKERLLRMTEPIDAEQVRSITGKMLEGEKRMILHWLSEEHVAETVANLDMLGPLGLGRPLLKPRALLNLEARNHTIIQTQIKSYTPENTDAWVEQARKTRQQFEKSSIRTWRILYNPVGKIAMVLAGFEYEGFVPKVSNLTGITRLARLQVEIATTEKPVSDIPACIAADKSLYNPFTGKPFEWDSNKRQIYLELRGNLAEGTSKRVAAEI